MNDHFRVCLGVLLFCCGGPTLCLAGDPIVGTFRSAPGTVAEYVYHAGEYFTVEVPVDVTVTFPNDNSLTLSAIIHQPIIGVDEHGDAIFGIANEFPMAVTGTSSDGRDFHGDLLGTQYLFDWTFEPAAGGNLILNGQVGWAGGRVEITTITNARLLPALAGDYNHDLKVDQADFVLWRQTVGQAGIGLAADGNGDGVVDAGDYDVWRANFGAMIGNGSNNGQPVPEPGSTVTLLLAGIATGLGWRRAAERRAANRASTGKRPQARPEFQIGPEVDASHAARRGL